MSSSAEEFVVDGQLADWLDRHGVHAEAGDRVRFWVVPHGEASSPIDGDELWGAFVGRFESDEPGLARRAKDIVRAEMAE